ncbi:MAG: hypothetical protein CL843_01155 [Crocinitomicaceae bacterium]|nr:hypothetical protein [Crocinitomicaceae bacterium]|tara:strand:- start:93 stop:1586 length:1494 start_codon:yes stop_codon:yes gene_type:complete
MIAFDSYSDYFKVNAAFFITVFILLFSIPVLGQPYLFDQNYGYSICSTNAICENDEWCNQIRSVVVICRRVNGVDEKQGAGFLVTNDRSDGRPYLMTSQHIINFNGNLTYNIDQAELDALDSMLFIFNYQYDTCSSNMYPYSQSFETDTIRGAYLRSYSIDADFAILELKERPPIDFEAYYSGYNAAYERPESGAIIHHPQTDIKKIAFYDTQPTRYYINTEKWKYYTSSGLIQSGSSGAPMYDQDKKIVGCQSMANTSITDCDESTSTANYAGRLEEFWESQSTSTRQAKAWLNPNATSSLEIVSMSGYDPCASSYSFTNASDLHQSTNVDPLTPSTPLPGTRSYDGRYFASNSITAGTGVTISAGTSVEFHGKYVELNTGFQTGSSSVFIATPEPCSQPCSGSNKQSVVASSSTILENAKVATNMQLYPNPAKDMVTVELTEKSQVSIYNVQGQLQFRKTLPAGANTLPLDQLSSGIYIVKADDLGLSLRVAVID